VGLCLNGVDCWARPKEKGKMAQPKRKRCNFFLFENISNGFELIRLNDGLPLLEKFQIKYGFEGFEIRNNFH
jgi:hypothetical protein